MLCIKKEEMKDPRFVRKNPPAPLSTTSTITTHVYYPRLNSLELGADNVEPLLDLPPELFLGLVGSRTVSSTNREPVMS